MRLLLWHVHGGWTDAFVRGGHEYLMPTTPDRGPWGLGRGGRDWPAVVEVAPQDLRAAQVDVVVAQRPEEIATASLLLGHEVGKDLPVVYVEHNTPRGDPPTTVHPLADRDDVTIVHVTHFNSLVWDCGRTRTAVVEHGVVDPGALYTGTAERIGVVSNEPVRRDRVVGTDLLPAFAMLAPLDVYGISVDRLPSHLGLGPDRLHPKGDLTPEALHASLARRRLYLHPTRWTSLGLSLLEAMQLGMPVVVLATTEASRAVPPEAGAVSSDVGELVTAARRFLADPDAARRAGQVAREAVLQRYSLRRFLDDWDDLLDRVRQHGGRGLPKERGTA